MEREPRKKYSREFKPEAVRLAAVDERPKAQVARELGIRLNLLRNWRLDSNGRSASLLPVREQSWTGIWSGCVARTRA